MALLLRHGARTDVLDASGCPPLLLAAQRGDCPTLLLLLGAGAPPNVANKFGRSALSLAAERGHPEACQLLLARALPLAHPPARPRQAPHASVGPLRARPNLVPRAT